MPIRLEDYLENPNLLTKKIDLENEIEQFRFPSDDDYYNEDLLKTGQPEQPIDLPQYLFTDPEIVGYPDLEMQQQIYDWVQMYLPVGNYSIKDLGAGRGDFYNHIWNNGNRNIEYIGIENKESLCRVGQLKYPGIDLLNQDFFGIDARTDYTVCIGTLNDNHGQNKWKYFNETLNFALSNTNHSVIFVLSSNMDDLDSFYDYPLSELFENLPSNLPYKIDYSKFQDIYVLVVYVQPFT